jgi:hypothetical protein
MASLLWKERWRAVNRRSPRWNGKWLIEVETKRVIEEGSERESESEGTGRSERARDSEEGREGRREKWKKGGLRPAPRFTVRVLLRGLTDSYQDLAVFSSDHKGQSRGLEILGIIVAGWWASLKNAISALGQVEIRMGMVVTIKCLVRKREQACCHSA